MSGGPIDLVQQHRKQLGLPLGHESAHDWNEPGQTLAFKRGTFPESILQLHDHPLAHARRDFIIRRNVAPLERQLVTGRNLPKHGLLGTRHESGGSSAPGPSRPPVAPALPVPSPGDAAPLTPSGRGQDGT